MERPRGKTLVDIMRETAYKYPDHTAIICYGQKLTYRQLDKLSDICAKVFSDLGVYSGSRVSFLVPQTKHIPICFYAAWKLGAAVAAANYLESTDKIREMVALADPQLIVILDLFEPIGRVLQGDPVLRGRCKMTVSIADCLSPLKRLFYILKTKNIPKLDLDIEWEKAMKKEASNVRLFRGIKEARQDDVAILQYSGGTTGDGGTKAAMLTHYNLVTNAWQTLKHINQKEEVIGPGTVFLGVLPFFHVYAVSAGLTLALSSGSAVALCNPPKKEALASSIVKTVRKYKVTVAPLVPEMYRRLVIWGREHPHEARRAFQSVKFCFSGGEHLPTHIKSEFEAIYGVKVIEAYGLTEASPVVLVNPIDNPRPGTLGIPVPETELHIAEDGELWVRGPQVMSGYWRNKEATEKAITPCGWLKTGDIVEKDQDGYYRLIDRKKNMGKRKGEQVFAKPVEKILLKHPSVAEAAVVWLKADDDQNDKMIAFVVLKHGRKLTKKDLVEYFRNEGYKSIYVPDEIRICECLPKSAVGKILHRELKKQVVPKQAPTP